MSLTHQDFIFCQKHLEQAFFCIIFFHSDSFNETFIISGKSHCCSDTFTDVRFTSLLAKNASKEYLRRIQIIFLLLESAFHWLLHLKFLFKLVTSKSYARKQKWVFFSEHSVYSTMKTKETKTFRRYRLKPSKIKARSSRPTCKNC